METERHSTSLVRGEHGILASVVADFQGPEIDMGDVAEGNAGESVTYVIGIAGALAGGGWDITFQESDTTGSGFTNVSPDEIVGGITLTDTATKGIAIPIANTTRSYRLGTISKKQFIRISFVETGTITTGQRTIMYALIEDLRRGAQPDQSS